VTGRLFTKQHQQVIAEVIAREGQATVEALCQLFDVSSATIRRDLDELDTQGVVIRTTVQLATSALVLAAEATAQTASTPLVGLIAATVVRVIDGDTVDVAVGGETVRLRLIGIKTPETKDPRKPVECFGREATHRAEELLDGQTVRLEADPSQDDRDKYNRLLRYIWLPNDILFNREMIAQGYAFEYTFKVPYKYQAEFQQAQREAREQQRNLWSPSSCNGQHIPAEPAPPAPAPTKEPAAGNCDPSYPDVWIPPPPPTSIVAIFRSNASAYCRPIPIALMEITTELGARPEVWQHASRFSG
jgi:endonuclease YncB( thermonuclease family)